MCSHLVLHSPRNTYLLGWLIHKYMRWIRFAVNGKAQDSDLHLGRRRVSRTDVICNCDITGSAKSNLIPSATDVVALLCNICKALITRCLAPLNGCPFPSFSIRTATSSTAAGCIPTGSREITEYHFSCKFRDKFHADFHRINKFILHAKRDYVIRKLHDIHGIKVGKEPEWVRYYS